jgi:hypothetical protein
VQGAVTPVEPHPDPTAGALRIAALHYNTAMVDHRKITGPEFVIIDGVAGDAVAGASDSGQSDSKYFIGRDSPQSPLRWGILFSAVATKDIGIARLKDDGLAKVDGKWLIIDRPACIRLRGEILTNLNGGLLGRLLKKLVISAGDKPGEMVDPDGIYGELGIGDRAHILTKTLIDKGLVTMQMQYQKASGVKFSLVVTDEAKRVANRGRWWRGWFTTLGKSLHEQSAKRAAGLLIGAMLALLGVLFGGYRIVRVIVDAAK